MENAELLRLRTQLAGLTVFRQLLSDEVIASLCRYLESLDDHNTEISLSAYCRFVSNLYEKNAGNLTSYIEHICGNSENVYVKMIGRGQKPSEYVRQCMEHELDLLGSVAALTPEQLTQPLNWQGFVPAFTSQSIDLKKSYAHRVENINKYGYGKYARNKMFYVDEQGCILAVKNPDSISLDALVEYESERNQIMNNTKALLNGKPAANILLTGDAGTGKSSTVKAIANALYSEGLRIIEVRKDQLRMIPKILNELSDNPLKFILFIDDLSFVKNDDHFNVLKAVLEGSVSTKSNNVVIYATSNRRHIIKESFSDREGDDIHRNDTMQELISLSSRFGLHITYQKPDKQTYLRIVENLAERENISMDAAQLELQAERFALEKGGRSARSARQFVDKLLSEQ